MRECCTKGTNNRRVRKISLQSRYGEFLREVCKERISNTEITFRILEIYRVDLVWHRRGAHFSFLGRLRHPAVADVAPHVLREVGEYRVGAAQVVEEFGERIVRFDLGRHLV